MSEELLSKTIPNAVNTAIGPLSQTAANLTENVAGPVTKGMGGTLNDLWTLIFGRIGFAADKRRLQYEADLEKFKQQLNADLDVIPEGKRVEPNLQVAMSTMSDSQFCVEEPELRSMFSKLLASACNADTTALAHPSFSSIIKRMSSYDAVLLKRLAGASQHPIAEHRIEWKDGHYKPLERNLLSINRSVVKDYKATSASIDILCSLGLVECQYDVFMSDQSLYKPFEDTQYYQSIKAQVLLTYSDKCKLTIQKGILKITDLGQQFIRVCIM